MHPTKHYSNYGTLKEEYQISYYPDTPINNSGWHKHDFYEIILILEHSVTYATDHGNYPANGGNLILISKDAVHCPLVSSPPLPTERYVLWLHKDFLETLCTGKTNLCTCFLPEQLHVIPLDALLLDQVRTALKIISDNEATVTYFGKDIIQRSYLQQFLVLVNSIYIGITPTFIPAQKVQEHNILAEEIMNYICTNFREDISLSFIADHFHLDKFYINRIFKKHYKTTIYHYILQKRLEYAKYLIKKGVSVNESYKICGFHDYCSFNRLFKQHYKETPMQYYKKHLD